MSHAASEIASQPDCWLTAGAQVTRHTNVLPQPGERWAVTGCGTSWFMAQSYAALREDAGMGETDVFPASEFPTGRRYDGVLALTRSGTTTEVLELLSALRGETYTVAITADPNTPVVDIVDDPIVFEFADERSVVQTRFATTTLAFLRASLGSDVDLLAADGRTALEQPLADPLLTAEQRTFLGHRWTYGIAQEAALKMREAAGSWTEAYPAMEYRHGPISIAAPGRLTWSFGPPPPGLTRDIEATGADFWVGDLDPLAELVRAQRVAVAVAESRGLDPDTPRHLARSVILGPA